MIAEDETAAGNEEGENYFVSMTDMMIGVLFIFLIMLMSFALKFHKQTEDSSRVVKEVAPQLVKLQEDVERASQALQQARADRIELLQKIAQQLEQQNLRVQVDQEHGLLRLGENAVHFATNSAQLDAENKRKVELIADVLGRILPAYAQCKPQAACAGKTALETLLIEGHADTTGVDADNWSLSTNRAVSTYRAMIEKAPALRKLRNKRNEEIISVSGYGSTRAISEGKTVEALASNRRIDLRFVMDTDKSEELERVARITGKMRIEIDRLRDSIGLRK